MDWLNNLGISGAISDFSIFPIFTFLIRFLLPALAIIILIRCTRSLLREKYYSEEWGYLSLPNGSKIKLSHWENIIGRSKASDVFMEYPTLSRSHAALIRDADGNWLIYDLNSKGGVFVNGNQVQGQMEIYSGDIILMGGVELVFVAITKEMEIEQAKRRPRPGKAVRPGVTLIFVTEFQVLLGVQLCIASGDALSLSVPISFLVLIGIMWLCYILTRAMNRVGFEIETLAFFLCSIGMAVTASSAPDGLYKQCAFLAAGVVLYFGLGWFLRNLDRVKKIRLPVAVGAILLLAVNLVLSETVFGAKNWLSIGGITFQPSEFVKIAFVLTGAATMDRLFARRNLIVFIGFSGACVIALALMSDFGTALVFFVAYLIIAFLRSGDFATIFLSVGGAGFAGFLAMTLKSHIAARFASWGHVWDFPNDGGYQQTRTMSAASSGGLFGVGAGNGWLREIFAADTDLVFGMVCEEEGLIIAIAAIAAILILAIFCVRASASARSSFYVIAACAAATIMMFQVVLNVFGSVDILPLTGVTFPFVSRGGSSLISCWGLLAFIKAVDTRQNASFAIKVPKQEKHSEPEYELQYGVDDGVGYDDGSYGGDYGDYNDWGGDFGGYDDDGYNDGFFDGGDYYGGDR